MNQGTRIVVAILVLVLLLTGVYWLVAGPRKPASTAPPGSVSETTSQPATGAAKGTPTAPLRTGTSGQPAGASGRPRSGTGSDAGARPGPGSPASSPAAGTAGGTGSDRVSMGDGVRIPATPPAGGASGAGAAAPAGERAWPRGDVGGKGDVPDVPNFSRKPVGPLPSLANMPAGFVSANSAGGSGAAGPAPVVGGSAPAAAPPTPVAPPAASTPRTPGPAPSSGGSNAGAPPSGARTVVPDRPGPAAVAIDEYVVQDGDTFTTIADMWFGDGRKWTLIQAANEGVDPARLRIGQKLKLPGRSAGAPPAAGAASGARAATPPAVTDATSHLVAEGDTLYSIAKARLGDGLLWEELYEANKAAIGGDPKSLKVGTRLKLPPRTTR